MVTHVNGIVQAIYKQIIAFYVSTHAGYNTVRVNKPAGVGVVVSALEVVEPGLGVVVVAAVADGVYGAYGCGKRAVVAVVVRNFLANYQNVF